MVDSWYLRRVRVQLRMHDTFAVPFVPSVPCPPNYDDDEPVAMRFVEGPDRTEEKAERERSLQMVLEQAEEERARRVADDARGGCALFVR